MSSTSSVGSTRIVLQFALSRNVDAAAQDVQNAVSQAAGLLPREINPAQIQKEDPSAARIMHLILRSKTSALPLLNQFAKDSVALHLASVPEAGQIATTMVRRSMRCGCSSIRTCSPPATWGSTRSSPRCRRATATRRRER